MRHKPTDEHKLSYSWLKDILNTILRMENIGQIYHKHKIREILNWGMTKALEQDFELKKHTNQYKKLFVIPNLKLQMKL